MGLNKALLVPSAEGLPQLRGIEKLNTGDKRSSPRSILLIENKIYCSTNDGKIIAWKSEAPFTKEVLVGYPTGSILTMIHSANKNTLFYAIQGNIYQYDLKSRTPKQLFQNKSIIRQLAIVENETQSMLTFADEQGNITTLNLQEASPQPKLIYQQNNRGGIYALTYIPQRKWLVAGDVSGRLIVLWDISVENLQKADFTPKFASEKKHKGIVRTIVTSPDNQYIATGGWDGMVLLWKMDNIRAESLINEPMLSIQNEGKVLSVQFDRKSEYLFISDESNLHICPTRPHIFYEKICQRIKKQADTKEWKDFYSREDNKIIRDECKCISCE